MSANLQRKLRKYENWVCKHSERLNNVAYCCWADDECEAIIMRRPTFCSAFDEDDHTITTSPAPSDKVSVSPAKPRISRFHRK
ncbi:hypothetical protein RUM44_013544 [Polyplax serrata]|uniref:Uncharacterized protein n=1 Tax=Polyplax serrata TaxID=468196 RepID=A0ABR1BI39_POLSC